MRLHELKLLDERVLTRRAWDKHKLITVRGTRLTWVDAVGSPACLTGSDVTADDWVYAQSTHDGDYRTLDFLDIVPSMRWRRARWEHLPWDCAESPDDDDEWDVYEGHGIQSVYFFAHIDDGPFGLVHGVWDRRSGTRDDALEYAKLTDDLLVNGSWVPFFEAPYYSGPSS